MPCDVACVVLCVVLIIELLPTQSNSKILPSIVKCQTVVVAGTYGLAVLLFKLHVLVGYNKFSFYQDIVAPRLFTLMGARDGHLVNAQSAGCCSL